MIQPSDKAKRVAIGSRWRPASFETRRSDGTYQSYMRADEPIIGPDRSHSSGWFAPTLFVVITITAAIAVFAHT